jgi:hypothetical protein
LVIHTSFPSLPPVGQRIFITAYATQTFESEEGDYFAFVVHNVEYDWHAPNKAPEITLSLNLDHELRLESEAQKEHAARAYDVLVKIYGWDGK